MTDTPAQPASLFARCHVLARDIKLSHSLFALPFALLAMFLAGAWAQRLPTAMEILLIVLCMIFARTAAMAFNRWADAAIDAANPRTAARAIPSGRLTRRDMLFGVMISGALFIIAAGGFWWLYHNPWPVMLAPFVLIYLLAYSFTKRLTWLCHVYLGTALALSPVAATIALEPGFLQRIDIWLLALMVACWVAGFDIIYALQDVAVDRAAGLHSMPAQLGVPGAMWISRMLHLIAAAALLLLWRQSFALHGLFLFAVLLTLALLLLEHTLIHRSQTNHLHLAFFTINGIISLILGGAGIVDVLLTLR